MEEARQHRISELQEELAKGRVSRREFIWLATALGVSLGAAQALAGCKAAPTAAPPAPTQAQVSAPTTAPAPTQPPAPTEAPAPPAAPAKEAKAGMRLVFDPYQCTGCLQCAQTCAEKWAAELFPDQTKNVVNLEFSRIRPMRFQYVDVVNVCQYCSLQEWAEGSNETPCQSVCPQKAIVAVPEGQGKPGFSGMGYRTIDRGKCLGLEACGRCLEICEQEFGSGVSFDPIEQKAQVCTLCGGTPACVEVCNVPGALQFVPVMENGRTFAHPPEAYAELLYMKMFNKRRDL